MIKFRGLNAFVALNWIVDVDNAARPGFHGTATLLNMPVNTVKNYDRKLMEAGLRTKRGLTGRGQPS